MCTAGNCTPPLVKKAGVPPDVTLRFTVGKQVGIQARESPWLWNPWGGWHIVQNWGNHWPHKMDLGPTKNFKKEEISKVQLSQVIQIELIYRWSMSLILRWRWLTDSLITLHVWHNYTSYHMLSLHQVVYQEINTPGKIISPSNFNASGF